MQAERAFLGLMSFVCGLCAALNLLAGLGERWDSYVSALVLAALMLVFGLAWLALGLLEPFRRAGREIR
ncbi:hypothetical protein [Thermomonospora umbrina]|uniref:Uncharacterized protein n=1 Tax=Thermomonospora umbrina TaxID=111806 RepID=A0A3D9STN6_9ACTN|nr:hypothetical protein [Thermomonospora umbrina]REE96345.1 hypothetical protein DFJ69_1775 [Thermomonospora umbrina]